MNEESGMEHMTLERERMSNVGYERPMDLTRMLPRMKNNMNLGRDKLPWSQKIWNRIDQAVHDECKRTKIAAKFLPMYGPVSPDELTVPSDTIVRDGQTLAVDEAAMIPLIELYPSGWVQQRWGIVPRPIGAGRGRQEEQGWALVRAAFRPPLLSSWTYVLPDHPAFAVSNCVQAMYKNFCPGT